MISPETEVDVYRLMFQALKKSRNKKEKMEEEEDCDEKGRY